MNNAKAVQSARAPERTRPGHRARLARALPDPGLTARASRSATRLRHVVVHAAAAAIWALVLSGCASSPVPEVIRNEPVSTPTPAQVQASPEGLIGHGLRWGGHILGVTNLRDHTRVEILARPLGAEGEPEGEAAGLGRFILEIEGFREPNDFPKDRRLTAVGTLKGVETHAVGDYPYSYPVLRAQQWYLWPEPQPVPVVAPPFDGFWYRPWYAPWYGPSYGPWYGPRYGHW